MGMLGGHCEVLYDNVRVPRDNLLGPRGHQPPELEGVDWRLTELDEKAVAASADGPGPSLRFDAEKQTVSGSGGCNRLSGSYEAGQGTIHFGKLAMTMMACPEPGMKQETAFTRALGAARAYRIVDHHLLLLAGERILAKFQPAPSAAPRAH